MRIVPYLLGTFMVFSAANVSAQIATVNTSALAAAKKHVGAPGPLVGAGLPSLAVGGIGYGIYWVVRRRRSRKTTEV